MAAARPGGDGQPGWVERGLTRLSVPMIVGPQYRNGNAYFYRKVRRGDRVSSVYVGGGDLGLLVRMFDLDEQQEKRLAKLEEREVIEAILQGDRLVTVCCEGIEAIAREAIEAAGYHRHKRGPWRRRRGQ
jgi:hypothetical protein